MNLLNKVQIGLSFIEANEPFQAGNAQYAYGFIDVRLPGSFAMKNAMQVELDKMLYENATPAETLEVNEHKSSRSIRSSEMTYRKSNQKQ